MWSNCRISMVNFKMFSKVYHWPFRNDSHYKQTNLIFKSLKVFGKSNIIKCDHFYLYFYLDKNPLHSMTCLSIEPMEVIKFPTCRCFSLVFTAVTWSYLFIYVVCWLLCLLKLSRKYSPIHFWIHLATGFMLFYQQEHLQTSTSLFHWQPYMAMQ